MMDSLFTIAIMDKWWCGTREKNTLEINHAMRTTDFATEHFPLPPLQQVQLSIRTCRNFKQKNEKFLDSNQQK
jgi:hypothetical protein